MLNLGLRRLATHDVRKQFVIAPHHPDRMRRPLPGVIAAADDSFRQTLTWNVFRTLELIAPAFWLRRFQLRLNGEASLVPPQIISVRLWHALPLPPIQRIDGGRSDVVIDAVIETEHDLWTLLVPPGGALTDISERAADVHDAGGWFAGRRSHHCGVIECDTPDSMIGSLLKSRYARSRESASLRSSTRGPAAAAASTWGGLRWSDLAAVLAECRDADSLPPIERALARNAVDWLRSVGIEPTS
jgi:hypothetical protein